MTIGIIFQVCANPMDYLLFWAFSEEDKAWALDMDSSGTLFLSKEYVVGYDYQRTRAAPNGQLVLITSFSDPFLSCFFINKDRSIDNPIYKHDIKNTHLNYIHIVYNPWIPVAYIGTFPTMVKYNVDYPRKNISITTDTVILDEISSNMGFSKYANCLVVNALECAKGVRTIHVLSDGSFSTSSFVLDLGSAGTNSDLSVSPDGRWVVVTGMSMPNITVLKIHKDGTLSIVQQKSILMNIVETHFTHNGRLLIMLIDSFPYYIYSFSVNQETGELAIVDQVGPYNNPGLYSARPSGISPDGKYLLYSSFGPTPYNYYEVFRIEENGKLIWLKDKGTYIYYTRMSGNIEFVPPWREGYAPTLGWLAH